MSYRKRAGVVTTSLKSSYWRARGDDAPALLWNAARNLDDLDGDVLLAALAQWMDPQHREPDGTTWLTVDAVLDYRGLTPKTQRAGGLRYRAGHRREDRVRIAASMERLDQLWVHLQGVEMLAPRAGQRPQQTQYTHESRVLLLTERLTRDALPVAWRYAPGTWLTPFLTPPNRQTALLMQQALRYDPYRERWEKRLARYLTFHLRMDARRAAPLVRRIGPLEELNVPVDHRHPERTRTRFEAALQRLVHDGLIGAWTYTEEGQRTLASLPVRH